MKKIYKTYTDRSPHSFDGKKWTYKTTSFEVEVMSVVGIWAMVRRKGGVPFTCNISQLKEAK